MDLFAFRNCLPRSRLCHGAERSCSAGPHECWNDFDAADRVTAEGRAVVTAILAGLEGLGAVVRDGDNSLYL